MGTGKIQIIPIDVETLDDLDADYSVKPNVIKMDIEGGEAQALEGASRTIAECRPVVVSEVTGDGGPKVLAWLAWNGYRLWDLESGQCVTPDGHPFMIVAIPEENGDDVVTAGSPLGQALVGRGVGDERGHAGRT